MTESRIAKINLLYTLMMGAFMAFLGVKSCNESSNWRQQQTTNDKLVRIDSINDIQLINLRDISQEAGRSIQTLTSINIKSQRQIDSLHTEITQLKEIYKAGQKQLLLANRSFDRATGDSIRKEDSDSLIWIYTENQIERILGYLWLYGTHVTAPSYIETAQEKSNLIDTINKLSTLFSISTSDNAYLKRHPFVKKAANDYLIFLTRMANRLSYDQGSFIQVTLSIRETGERWPNFMSTLGFHDTFEGWKIFESELIRAEFHPQGLDAISPHR